MVQVVGFMMRMKEGRKRKNSIISAALGPDLL